MKNVPKQIVPGAVHGIHYKNHRIMINPLCKTQNGFTLLELSIVIVIIGLIVGGIMTGQDLISAASVRAQISQIEKYNTAVHAFQNKYGSLPGDLPVASATQFGLGSTASCNGSTGKRDGNGFIVGFNSPSQYILQWGETTLFWNDLSMANLIDSAFPGGGATYGGGGNCGAAVSSTLSPGAAYIGDYFPTAKIGNSNFIYVYQSDPNEGSGVDNQNWFGISAVTSLTSGGGMYSGPGISVLQAYRYDQKVDDGLPMSGKVRPYYINAFSINYTYSTAPDNATTCFNGATHFYSTGYQSGTNLNCTISVELQ